MIEALIGFAGVIVGSVITISRDSWSLWRERRKDGSYSAIRLICILEEYANDCVDVAGDDGTLHGMPGGRTEHGEDYCTPQVEVPKPLEFPPDIKWRSIDEGVMHRILALPNKARSTNRYIHQSTEFASPPNYDDLFEARQEGYARLGVDALSIVEELRKRHGISVQSRTALGFDWDSKLHLEGIIEQFEKKAAELEERRAALQAERKKALKESRGADQ